MPLTKREAAICTAYTGVMFGSFSDFHEYAEEIMGHPIMTHMFASEEVFNKLRELSKEDFIQLNREIADCDNHSDGSCSQEGT